MRKIIAVLLVLLVIGLGAAYRYQDALRKYPALHRLVSALPGFKAEPMPTPEVAMVPVATPTPLIKIKELPITLPLVDALFFVDRQFVAEMKGRLQLSDDLIERLRQAARNDTQSLRESETGETTATTITSGQRAADKLSEILGAERTPLFAEFVLQRWQYLGTLDSDGEVAVATATPLGELQPPPGVAPSSSPSPVPSPIAIAAAGVFAAPLDSRIVVNAPAYRMDVFENGQLIKSYKAAMGVPDFPVPMGLRKATTIIFNPTWTPPDEPWVESSATVKVGQKIAAGDKLNPLGVIKIPIGAPLLIHGGKPLAKIGTLASHGCVGLTDRQVQDFAKLLGRIGGAEVTDDELAARAADRKQTKTLKLKQTIPVELRYETILVEDGKLHVYPDVYSRDTNRRENLTTVLSNFGLQLTDLSEAERAQVDAAMAAFFVKEEAAPAQSATPLTKVEKAAQRKQALARDKLAKQFKTAKVAAIEIAALVGKGYPAPHDLDTGVTPKVVSKAVATNKK